MHKPEIEQRGYKVPILVLCGEGGHCLAMEYYRLKPGFFFHVNSEIAIKHKVNSKSKILLFIFENYKKPIQLNLSDCKTCERLIELRITNSSVNL